MHCYHVSLAFRNSFVAGLGDARPRLHAACDSTIRQPFRCRRNDDNDITGPVATTTLAAEARGGRYRKLAGRHAALRHHLLRALETVVVMLLIVDQLPHA